MIHLRQKYPFSCGAACFAMLTGCDEETAIKECQTDNKGTYTFNTLKALKNRKYSCYLINKSFDFQENIDFINLISKSWPLYLANNYINQGKRGRPSKRPHAVIAYNGMIYDPSEQFEIDIYCYEHTFNKRLDINSFILVELDK